MISTEKLREFILDTDSNVRNEAACYFYEGYIQDPQILSLTLQACQKYGFEDCGLLLAHASRQIVDDFTAAKLLKILNETDEINAQMHLTHLLNNASIGFLEKNIDAMPTRVDERQWNVARNRLEFDGYSGKQLWQALEEYSEKHENQQTDASYHGPLIASLAHHDFPDPSRICELIEEHEGKWLELFLIQLAAERKIEQVVPIINEKLAEDDLSLSDTCSKALARIGTESVVNAFKEGFKNGSWGYQLSASDIFGRIKLPQSEAAIIEILESNGKSLSRDIYSNLCFSLCDLFSSKAFDYGKEVLDDIETIEIDSMRERLMTVLKVLGDPVSSEMREAWEKEIALEPQRRKEHFRKKHPELHRLGETIRNLVENHDPADILNILENNNEPDISNSFEKNIPSGRRIESINSKPSMKIGRNSPCYCGSGKKYKKCCINNN